MMSSQPKSQFKNEEPEFEEFDDDKKWKIVMTQIIIELKKGDLYQKCDLNQNISIIWKTI